MLKVCKPKNLIFDDRYHIYLKATVQYNFKNDLIKQDLKMVGPVSITKDNFGITKLLTRQIS